MVKVRLLALLIMTYIGYSLSIYTSGTASSIITPESIQNNIDAGKGLYQQYNCGACHQIFGLGGYLGSELTTAYSDKDRGEKYMRALLQSGGNRMPNFHFNTSQIDALIAYLKYVDTTATPIKKGNSNK